MQDGTFQMSSDAGAGVVAAFGAMFWMFIIAAYLFFAYTQYRIAQKAGCNNAWWAFIPIMNMILLTQTANKPAWWFAFMLVPIANIFVLGYLWAETAKNINHPAFWGWMMLVPVMNIVSPIVLAFSGSPSGSGGHSSAPSTASRQPEHVG